MEEVKEKLLEIKNMLTGMSDGKKIEELALTFGVPDSVAGVRLFEEWIDELLEIIK